MRYGYVRVSSRDQRIDRQMEAMLQAGLAEDVVFVDMASGKNFQRVAYQALVEQLREGDVIVVKSIDRLGRNYDEIIEQWQFLVKQLRVDIEVLDFPLLNTQNRSDSITGQLIADLVLQILSYVSQMEREQIHSRQAEGIRAARKRGVRFGRPSLSPSDNFHIVAQLYRDGCLSLRDGAMREGVSKSTFHNWIRSHNQSCPKK